MFDKEEAWCLLFVPADGKSGNPRKSSCTAANPLAKGYALFPQPFKDRHAEVVEIFSRNDVRVLSNDQDDSSLQTDVKNFAFEMCAMQVSAESPEIEDLVSDAGSPLFICVESFNIKVVASLFRRNAHVFGPWRDNGHSYFSLDSDDNLKLIENFLLCGRTIGYRHSGGGTILHFTVKTGMKNLVKLLLQYEPDVNTKRLDDMTPLHIAAMERQEEIVGILLEHGADVNARGLDGLSPLHVAVTEGHVGVVKSLLQHGADANARVEIENQRGWTSLVFAQHNQHREVAELLLESGADVNTAFECCMWENSTLYLSNPEEKAKGITKATILYSAALTKDFKLMKSVLRQQPDVANEYNRRAFHFVLIELEDDFKDIFKQMKQYGFTIDYDRFNNSVKFLCGAIHKNCFEVVRKMVEEGAEINKVYNRVTPLHMAARHAGMNIIKLLLDHGADVNVEFDKQFPIHVAFQNNNINVVRYFITSKINFPDKADLMSCAVRTGSVEMIELLLRSGYPVTCKDEYNKAVGVAASTGCMEGLELLFTHGAQLGSKWNFWKLLQTAMSMRHSKMLQTILDHSLTYVQFTDFTQIFRKLALYSILRSNSYFESKIYLNVLAQHILKLEAASLCDLNQNLTSFWHASESIDDFRNRCEMEVTQLKSERVGDSQVVFFDFLTQNLNKLAGFARNDSIVKAVTDDNCCVEFPIYSSLLNRQFKKGLRRKELMQQGMKTCNVLYPEKRFYNLPYELKVKIIIYLSNCDLLVLNNILPTGTRSEGHSTVT